MAQYASLHADDPDAHDHVYGIVLPKLQKRYDTLTDKKEEFTEAQARAVDFTALPLRINHNRDMHQVGLTVAYRVRDVPGELPRAEAIFRLNREPDKPHGDELSRLAAAQRNYLMEGTHRGLSLGHLYSTEYVGNCGVYAASIGANGGGEVAHRTDDPHGDPGNVVYKEGEEISVCDRGLRDGSEILEYLPCRRSLERSCESAVRKFVKLYNYAAPPSTVHYGEHGWRQYIDTLSSSVRERRDRVLSQNGYNELLGARGVHAASADRLQKKLLKNVPWVMLPYVEETTKLRNFNLFASLGREVGRNNE